MTTPETRAEAQGHRPTLVGEILAAAARCCRAVLNGCYAAAAFFNRLASPRR